MPASLEALAQSILAEAVRNAHKHAARERRESVRCATTAARSSSRCATTAPTCTADGHGGVGLRLATLEALQHDGVLEYGEPEPGAWQVRLVVPIGQ